MFVIWEKILNLSLRQITFGGNINTAINQFTSLANTLQRFGEDKATEGLLGAIGLGKKSIYSLEYVYTCSTCTCTYTCGTSLTESVLKCAFLM